MRRSKLKIAGNNYHKTPSFSAWLRRKEVEHIAQDDPLWIDWDTVVDSQPVRARVERGRWLADCQLNYGYEICNGAELVDPNDRLFFCISCRNAKLNGALRPVFFPDSWWRIEDELLQRKYAVNRNWEKGETIDGLRAEHIEHNPEALNNV